MSCIRPLMLLGGAADPGKRFTIAVGAMSMCCIAIGHGEALAAAAGLAACSCLQTSAR